MNLKLVIEALQRREDYWRAGRGQDPYNISTAVMTALAEVRSALLEAEQLEEPVTPATPTEIVNPPRDEHLPHEKPAPSRS